MVDTFPEGVQEEKESFLKRNLILILGAIFCVALFLGMVLYAYYAPYREGVHLRVYVYYPTGFGSDGTYYVFSSEVSVKVENYGTERALAEKITLEITGKNVVREILNWTWGDLKPEYAKTVNVPFEVKNESQPFTLEARVYYEGKLHSEAHIP